MYGKRRLKDNARKRGLGGYAPLMHRVIRSAEYIRLSRDAKSLLIDLLAQYTGNNNGDFCLTWKRMKERGWRSPDTLNKARKELINAKFIVVSRQGGRHCASLYAVTFYAIDECKGKHDIRSTFDPSDSWKVEDPRTPLSDRDRSAATHPVLM
jgi:hypothetical protein